MSAKRRRIEAPRPERMRNRYESEYSDHKSHLDCEEAAKLQDHLDIMALVISSSEMTTIFVGKEKRSFSAHKDLLALHSAYFRNRFLDAHNDDDKITLPNFKPYIFADFHSWLYSGQILQVPGDALNTPTSQEELWALANFLEAPVFQNHCMDLIRTDCKTTPNNFVCIDSIESMYNVTKPRSLLRKFMADVMNCKNPFQTLQEGSEAWKDWETLLKRLPELSIDMARASGKHWNDSFPWDEKHREAYMEKELPLEEVWDMEILAKRSKAEVEEKSKAGDLQKDLQFSTTSMYIYNWLEVDKWACWPPINANSNNAASSSSYADIVGLVLSDEQVLPVPATAATTTTWVDSIFADPLYEYSTLYYSPALCPSGWVASTTFSVFNGHPVAAGGESCSLCCPINYEVSTSYETLVFTILSTIMCASTLQLGAAASNILYQSSSGTSKTLSSGTLSFALTVQAVPIFVMWQATDTKIIRLLQSTIIGQNTPNVTTTAPSGPSTTTGASVSGPPNNNDKNNPQVSLSISARAGISSPFFLRRMPLNYTPSTYYSSWSSFTGSALFCVSTVGQGAVVSNLVSWMGNDHGTSTLISATLSEAMTINALPMFVMWQTTDGEIMRLLQTTSTIQNATNATSTSLDLQNPHKTSGGSTPGGPFEYLGSGTPPSPPSLSTGLRATIAAAVPLTFTIITLSIFFYLRRSGQRLSQAGDREKTTKSEDDFPSRIYELSSAECAHELITTSNTHEMVTKFNMLELQAKSKAKSTSTTEVTERRTRVDDIYEAEDEEKEKKMKLLKERIEKIRAEKERLERLQELNELEEETKRGLERLQELKVSEEQTKREILDTVKR
ncbi:hypothetical protein G7Y89_g2264 [Cudoniella acicularis]|uniref:BTB domain-containing protein n=1 Tax=Cudoniella acicularis TaxID=354080 RepID=A0A8H4RUU4_9HELO|nr:hypothetical protein G7Y89_g2264 [Cudoniella acicularis]